MAQDQVERQHIQNLMRYFTQDGKPRFWKMQLPSMSAPPSEDKWETYNIPMISLVPQTAIRIKEMNVDFRVRLTEVANLKKAIEKTDKDHHEVVAKTGGDGQPETAEILSCLGPDAQKKLLDVDVSPGMFSGRKGAAKISITFEGTEPAEGYVKLNDLLIRLI